MTDLVWKDIMAVRWFLALLIPFYALQLAVSVAYAPMFFLETALFTALLVFGPIGLEDHQNTESLWCSLPVTRRQVVLARYASTLLGLSLGLAVSCLVGRAVAHFAVLGEGRSSAPTPSLQGYAVLFIFISLLAAVFLPCYFRLGAGKGLMAFSAIGIGALILVPALLQLVLFLAGYSSSLLDPELWRGAADRLAAGDRSRLAYRAIAGMAAAALAAVFISAGLSVLFYEKRDLSNQ